MKTNRLLTAALLSAGLLTGQAHAGAIISAVSATVDAGGTFAGTSINDTLNQNGLLTGYTAGVTDFDTYLAGNPQHSLAFANNEWFAAGGTTGQVTYNLGGIRTIDGMALWNEDASGILRLNLLTSTDGVNFTPLLSGLTPTNNPISADYGADVFGFGAISAQYVRLDLAACDGLCSIGEVAFREGAAAAPAPGVLGLLGLGLAGIAALRRKVA